MNALVDIAGVLVSFRITQGSAAPAPAPRSDLREALEEAIESRKRLVIVEATGLRPKDKIRARILIDALKEAVMSVAGEKPLCMPPSSVSGLVSCSFKAYYENFEDFRRELAASIERSLYSRMDSLGVAERLLLSGALKALVIAAAILAAAVLALVYIGAG